MQLSPKLLSAPKAMRRVLSNRLDLYSTNSIGQALSEELVEQ